jgi:hypothetical protein
VRTVTGVGDIDQGAAHERDRRLCCVALRVNGWLSEGHQKSKGGYNRAVHRGIVALPIWGLAMVAE